MRNAEWDEGRAAYGMWRKTGSGETAWRIAGLGEYGMRSKEKHVIDLA